MKQAHKKKMMKQTFDTVADGYDRQPLRFFQRSARNMATLLRLSGREHVLDVACGTGNASLAIAEMLPEGRVTAADFSPGMLEKARQRAEGFGLGNITFVERDMEDLGFPHGIFDVAVCAFGIFFVEDMDTQLARIASVVRPGGRVMISNFEEGFFHPLRDLFVQRIQAYGVPLPPPTWKRIAHEQGCRQLFENAGLVEIRVESRNVGYHLETPGQWWDIVWNAGFRGLVSQLKEEERERFKQEHLREVETLRTADGIRLDVGVLYTVGTRPDGE